MDIHEYQAKQLLRPYGVISPPGECAFTAEEAEGIARRLGGGHWAVKAQILAGDRSLAGGVKMVTSEAEVRERAREMLGTRLMTPQTGAGGEYVHRVYVERVCRIRSEHYLALALDRDASKIVLVGSDAGGSSIESVAANHQERIVRMTIDPLAGLIEAEARDLSIRIGLGEKKAELSGRLMAGLFEAFIALDASLIEINPLALTVEDELLALDAKMSIDDNALFRHREIEDLRERESDGRLARARHGFNYIPLDGDIGCVVNGAGVGDGHHGSAAPLRRRSRQLPRSSTFGLSREHHRGLQVGDRESQGAGTAGQCGRGRSWPLRRDRRGLGRGLQGRGSLLAGDRPLRRGQSGTRAQDPAGYGNRGCARR